MLLSVIIAIIIILVVAGAILLILELGKPVVQAPPGQIQPGPTQTPPPAKPPAQAGPVFRPVNLPVQTQSRQIPQKPHPLLFRVKNPNGSKFAGQRRQRQDGTCWVYGESKDKCTCNKCVVERKAHDV